MRPDEGTDSIDENDRLRVVEPGVAARIMEGEAIFINLTSGLYYSMDASGGAMWSLLGGGHTIGETAARIAQWYGVPEDTASKDVRAIVDRLLEEKLVIIYRETAGEVPTGGSEPPADTRYRSPELHRFDDMAELFALDPPLPELPDPPRAPGA